MKKVSALSLMVLAVLLFISTPSYSIKIGYKVKNGAPKASKPPVVNNKHGALLKYLNSRGIGWKTYVDMVNKTGDTKWSDWQYQIDDHIDGLALIKLRGQEGSNAIEKVEGFYNVEGHSSWVLVCYSDSKKPKLIISDNWTEAPASYRKACDKKAEQVIAVVKTFK